MSHLFLSRNIEDGNAWTGRGHSSDERERGRGWRHRLVRGCAERERKGPLREAGGDSGGCSGAAVYS
jgi:hypothetical protein